METNFRQKIENKIALLIDGDNAQPALIESVLTESGKFGSITIRRIYGDWTSPNMKSWKGVLNNNAIQPIQQFRYTIGKNATDSAMIIDAMDILHSDKVDGFCLVSSDSDYTRLATRIREMGYFVVGIGKQSTPKAFINACNVFIYTENLTPLETFPKAKKPIKKSASIKDEERKIIDPLPLLKAAIEMAIQENEWANLATVGFYLHQLDPGFDPRTYGYKQLSQLLKKYNSIFELRFIDQDGLSVVYIRFKQ